jgi:hypothetical protein
MMKMKCKMRKAFGAVGAIVWEAPTLGVGAMTRKEVLEY